jgi:hypothetical protein
MANTTRNTKGNTMENNWQDDNREVEHILNSRHIRLVDDPQDPEHDPIGDADTEYDIEFDADDEPEDDGQPSEYEEWQDYMGGDEYYDHSENSMW